MMPAIAQGVIGVQQRANDDQMTSLLSPLNDKDTEIQVFKLFLERKLRKKSLNF